MGAGRDIANVTSIEPEISVNHPATSLPILSTGHTRIAGHGRPPTQPHQTSPRPPHPTQPTLPAAHKRRHTHTPRPRRSCSPAGPRPGLGQRPVAGPPHTPIALRVVGFGKYFTRALWPQYTVARPAQHPLKKWWGQPTPLHPPPHHLVWPVHRQTSLGGGGALVASQTLWGKGLVLWADRPGLPLSHLKSGFLHLIKSCIFWSEKPASVEHPPPLLFFCASWTTSWGCSPQPC